MIDKCILWLINWLDIHLDDQGRVHGCKIKFICFDNQGSDKQLGTLGGCLPALSVLEDVLNHYLYEYSFCLCVQENVR